MKNKIKAILADIVYWLHQKRILKTDIEVMTIDATLDELLKTNKSLVRFGDGEIVMICGKSLHFQHESEEIARRLTEILQYKEDDLMVAIPDIFRDLSQYRESGQAFWKDHLLFFRKVYQRYCTTQKQYGNAYVSRCYYNYTDKSQSEKWFGKIREIWKNKNIIVVEGEGTHNGVGNNLLSTALSVERILCPANNAGDFQEEILDACLKMPEDHLFLLSIGPAAKLLAQDLFNAGRRVIDIGNLDMEYEWFLQKATEKVKLKKHEIFGVNENQKAGYGQYLDEVKITIGI